MKRQRAAALIVAGLICTGTGCQGTINKLKANFAAKTGNDLYRAADYGKAVQWYRYSIYLNPELPIAYHNAGLSYLALYKPGSRHPKDLHFAQAAIDNLTQYLAFEPEDQDAKNQLLTVFLSAERYDEAAKFFEQEVERQSDDKAAVAKLAQILGMIYSKKGEFDASLEWYKRRAELESDNPEALYTIGVLCWEKVYKQGVTMELEKRKALIEMGLEYLNRAAELRENYFEAASYVNLMYRQKAQVAQLGGDMEEVQRLTQEADKYMRISLDMRKKAMAKK